MRFSSVCALLALLVTALDPSHSSAQQLETECFCTAQFGWRVREVPQNYRILVDTVRFDLSTVRMVLAPEPGTGVLQDDQQIPVGSETVFQAPMRFAFPLEDPIVGRKYGIIAFPAEGFPDDVITLGTTFTIEDVVDTEPPIAGALRVTGEVFTNNCGAQALVLEDAGTTDNFARGTRFPILVTLKGETTEFQTVTGTFGVTNDVNPAVVAKAPYLGSCITDEGLETLDFRRGESVEVTFVVYDYAGNASEPVVQNIAWPIGETEPSGCRVDKTDSASGALALVAFVLMALTRRRKGLS